jgi:hypothetical protein
MNYDNNSGSIPFRGANNKQNNEMKKLNLEYAVWFITAIYSVAIIIIVICK